LNFTNLSKNYSLIQFNLLKIQRLSLTVLAVVLFTVGNVFANDIKKTNPTVDELSLTQQIGVLLEKNTFDITKDLVADVRFVFNDSGEIVVLSVETANERLEGFVKGRLNYKKVKTNSPVVGKTYTVSVRITA